MKKYLIGIAVIGLIAIRVTLDNHKAGQQPMMAETPAQNLSFENGIAKTSFATVEVTGHQILKPDSNREWYKDSTLMLIHFKATNKVFEEGELTPQFLWSTAFVGKQEDKVNKSEQGLDGFSGEYLGFHNSADRVEVGQTAESSIAFVIRDNSRPLKLVAHNFAEKEIGYQYLPLE